MKSKVTIEHEGVTATIEADTETVTSIYDFMETLVRPALFGVGFHAETIQEYFKGE